MGEFAAALTSVLPIVVLIALGIALRSLRILDEPLVDGLKRLIVNVVLPVVLFRAFLSIEFAPEHLGLVLVVPAVCFVLLALGPLVRRLLGAPPVASLLMTGFEFGMVGLALFTAAYGLSDTPTMALTGLGHEFFIWFVFVTLLRRSSDGGSSLAATLGSFTRSPIILAIFAGLLLNIAGLEPAITGTAVGAGIFAALDHLAAMIVPVILLIIGYGSRLTLAGIRQALPLVAVRYVVTLALAIVASWLVVGQWLGLGPIAQAAVFLTIILPPPFIVPIMLPARRAEEITYANNVVSLSTLLTVATFVGYVILV